MKRLGGMKAAAVLAMVVLGGCESMSSLDPFAGGSVDYAAGAPAAAQLSGADRDALSYAFVRAMDTGSPQGWTGRRLRGVVEPKSYAIAGLKADPDMRLAAARGDFDLTHVVETDLGQYVLTRNSNVRMGPNVNDRIAEVLSSGTGVEVVGRVRDKNWMLVSYDGTIRGYVYGDLLIKAPGSELELAGGPMRKPTLCREFSQRINHYAERYEWDGAACNDGTGWRLAPEPPADEYAPAELFEF